MSILPSRQGTKVPTDEEFAFLLEDRAFVDYFNVFLTLPVFGQQIFYNFVEKAFVYDPPIKKKRNFVDRRCVIAYLIQERLPVFEKTTLFLEYLLCCRLRDVEVDFDNKTFKGTLPVKCQHLEVHAIVWLETGGEGRGKFKTNFPIAFPLALPYGLAKDASYLHDLTWV
uniref:Uncharacterized protein LOC111132255 n=1 Tax=Crassostrea virginica TaxID=6565 RepID=A0A8B8E6H8_CRAVI|nr:uncharacterized protein LOC111132255 [Crassostrea virginica]